MDYLKESPLNRYLMEKKCVAMNNDRKICAGKLNDFFLRSRFVIL